MGLLSFLQRKSDAAGPDKAPGRKSDAPSPDDVARARTRARQRLIGAVVLLGIAIVGFPLVFETQPRPVAVDLPIDIPRKESAPPLAVAPRHAAKAGGSVSGAVADAAADAPAAPASKPEAVATRPAPAAEKPPTIEAKPTPPRAPAEPRPAAEAKPAVEAKPAAEAAGRFVVQVGAFADAGAARETRQRVEKLGLKTYTQVVETDAGKRIRVRVGPFVTRDEADKAADRIKSAGLPSAILTL